MDDYAADDGEIAAEHDTLVRHPERLARRTNLSDRCGKVMSRSRSIDEGAVIMVDRQEVCDRAEAAVTEALRAEGFSVHNLNDFVKNCPYADLVARRGSERLMIQVRGTTTSAGKFGAPPEKAHKLVRFAEVLGFEPFYAFVHMTDEGTVIGWAEAQDVAVLAEQDEQTYVGINLLHVNIGQFPARSVDELRNPAA